jgi:hypothetical protein
VSPRGAYPEHFHSAAEHALRLASVGVGPDTLRCMAEGWASRGFVDAADGVTHVVIRLMVARLHCAGQCDTGGA